MVITLFKMPYFNGRLFTKRTATLLIIGVLFLGNSPTTISATASWDPVAYVAWKTGYGTGPASPAIPEPEDVCVYIQDHYLGSGSGSPYVVELYSVPQYSTIQYYCGLFDNGVEKINNNWPKPLNEVCRNNDALKPPSENDWRYPLGANTFDGQCRCPGNLVLDFPTGLCRPEYKPYQQQLGSPNTGSCPVAGNPIGILTGNKQEKIVEYVGKGTNPLIFERYFNSSMGDWIFGIHSIAPGISNPTNSPRFNENVIYLVRKNGQSLTFHQTQLFTWTSVQAPGILIEGTFSGWSNFREGGFKVTHADGMVEHYDGSGRILQIDFPNGDRHSYVHFDDLAHGGVNKRISVGHSSGDHYLVYLERWGDNFVSEANARRFEGPNGLVINYQYWWGGAPRTLRYAHYQQDGSTKTESYLYENADFPALLTGIVDKNGHRYVEWQYDDTGRAILSRHFTAPCDSSQLDQCAEVDRTEFDYTYMEDATDPRVTVTNPLGKATTYHYEYINGVKKTINVEGHQSNNCGAANKYTSYFDTGFVETKTDWIGNVTLYERDSLGRITKKTKGLAWSGAPQFGLNADITMLTDTPEKNTEESCWHPLYQQVARTITSDYVTTGEFNARGRIISTSTEPRDSSNDNCDFLMADDLDGDGLDDDWEKQFFDNYWYDGGDDNDGDGLTNAQEFMWGLDPLSSDSDGDSLDDGWEYQFFNGFAQDGSGDLDGDGFTNLQEFVLGLDPTIVNSNMDGDLLPDDWEITYFNTLALTPTGDFDNDGLTNLQEYLSNRNPKNPIDGSYRILNSAQIQAALHTLDH